MCPSKLSSGVCIRSVPDIQVCGTHGREDLVNATIISNAEEEEDEELLVGREPDFAGHDLRCYIACVDSADTGRCLRSFPCLGVGR